MYGYIRDNHQQLSSNPFHTMRNLLFLLLTLVLSFQALHAQRRPDLVYLTDGSVQRVVIRGEDHAKKLLHFNPWEGSRDRMQSRDLDQVHKIVYSYGDERVLNPLSEDADMADDIFGNFDEVEEEFLPVPAVENITLLLSDDTQAQLLDYSWTFDRLKLLRPRRYTNPRRGSRYSYSSRNRAPQWERIDLGYVEGVLLPGRVRLHSIREAQPTINDSTGWVQLRNGLKYAARSIEIRDRNVTFEEYYTRKVFKWEVKDVNYLVWEYQQGAVDFLRPGEAVGDTEIYTRGEEGSTDIEDILGKINNKQASGGKAVKEEKNEEGIKIEGKPADFDPLPFPIQEPSSLLQMEINSRSILNNNQGYALFSSGKKAEDLGDVRQRLDYLFNSKNYQDLRYYPVSGGFILLTPIEKFLDDGSSASWYQRFDIDASLPPKANRNFSERLENISFQKPGFYRMFAVVISDESKTFGLSQTKVSGGENLEAPLLKLRLNSSHKATFMVFEWSQISSGTTAEFKQRGQNKHSTYIHLKKSGLLEEMEK